MSASAPEAWLMTGIDARNSWTFKESIQLGDSAD
jgi:hypothetical protein